jgi:hypothetical protein
MTATKEQKRLIAIKCQDKETKEVLVQEVTGDYTKVSTNELTFDEANKVLESLGVKPFKKEIFGFDKNNTQHLRILSTLIQMGWSKPHDKYGEVADLDRFTNWLKSDKSPVKMNGRSSLLKLTKQECTKIIGALDKMNYKKYAKI